MGVSTHPITVPQSRSDLTRSATDQRKPYPPRSLLRDGGCSEGHSWIYGGPGQVTDPDVCERPKVLACSRCATSRVARCDSSRSSRCLPCSERYRRRVGYIAQHGLIAEAGQAFLLTLTAPGDEQHGYGGWKVCPCTPAEGVDLAAWNGSLGCRWNRFAQALRRQLGIHVEYLRGVETQRRGALHEHVLFRVPAGSFRISRSRLASIRLLAIEHGYGHELDLQVISGDRAAWYVAKYVTKATDERASIPWLNRRTGEVRRGPAEPLLDEERLLEVDDPRSLRATYRTWTASRRWGLTMTQLRQQQQTYARAVAAAIAYSASLPDERPKAALDENCRRYTQGPALPPPVVLGGGEATA